MIIGFWKRLTWCEGFVFRLPFLIPNQLVPLWGWVALPLSWRTHSWKQGRTQKWPFGCFELNKKGRMRRNARNTYPLWWFRIFFRGWRKWDPHLVLFCGVVEQEEEGLLESWERNEKIERKGGSLGLSSLRKGMEGKMENFCCLVCLVGWPKFTRKEKEISLDISFHVCCQNWKEIKEKFFLFWCCVVYGRNCKEELKGIVSLLNLP